MSTQEADYGEFVLTGSENIVSKSGNKKLDIDRRHETINQFISDLSKYIFLYKNIILFSFIYFLAVANARIRRLAGTTYVTVNLNFPCAAAARRCRSNGTPRRAPQRHGNYTPIVDGASRMLRISPAGDYSLDRHDNNPHRLVHFYFGPQLKLNAHFDIHMNIRTLPEK